MVVVGGVGEGCGVSDSEGGNIGTKGQRGTEVQRDRQRDGVAATITCDSTYSHNYC